MQNRKFFFKNTNEKKNQVEMAVDAKQAPDEFFFVHIKCLKTVVDEQSSLTKESEPLSKKFRLM